jgi:pimeloyl-ACP methyl ester carboxylesterase
MNSLRVRANGLDHHVLEWPCGTEHPPRGTVLLVHGYMDAAGTWDLVAPRLATAGYRVLAPDMRGFGDGARAPEGAYYHFTDYAFDLADLVAEASPEPVSIVGHSMGGNIATIFSGAFPERVARFVSLEGLGPPDNPVEVGPIRVRRWIDGVRRPRAAGDPDVLSGGGAPSARREPRERPARGPSPSLAAPRGRRGRRARPLAIRSAAPHDLACAVLRQALLGVR